MNKQTAIQLLYMDKECSDYCYKVAGDRYIADDLLQYSFEQLLLKDDDFVLTKYSDGSLKRYFAGIVYKSYHYPSSPFYIEHIKFNHNSSTLSTFDYVHDYSFYDEINPDVTVGRIDRNERRLIDSDHISLFSIVDNEILEKEILAYEIQSEKNWYEASILRLYFKYENLRDLSKALKIPVTSLALSINNIKTHLRDTLCEKYY